MKTIQTFGTLALGLTWAFVSSAEPVDDTGKYAKRMTFTVGVDAYTGATALSGLPVLVRLTPGNGFTYDDFVRTDYRDLAFRDGEGNLLPYAVDTWNPEGTSLVWVKVPSFTANTRITAYYGSEEPGDADSESVWSDYIGVWHMNEPGDGVVEVTDCTVNAFVGTTTTNSLAIADGAVGAARATIHSSEKCPSADGRIIVPYDEKMAVTKTLTASYWFRYDPDATVLSDIFFVGRRRSTSSGAWGMGLNYDSKNGYLLRAYCAESKYSSTSIGTKPPDTGMWHRVTEVHDGAKVVIYMDGVQKKSEGGVKAVEAAVDVPLSFGGMSESGYAFCGDLDEIRLTERVRSADWDKAEYAMVVNPAFLVANSAEDNKTPETLPVIGSAVTGFDGEGNAAISISLESGVGEVFVRLRDDSGAVVTQSLSNAQVTAPRTFTLPVAFLPKGVWYDVGGFADDGQGRSTVSHWSARVSNGGVGVSAVDASVDGLLPGKVRFFRVSGDLARQISLQYVKSGTAVSGTDYTTDIPGTVTIPAGKRYVEYSVTPKAAATVGRTVTVTLADPSVLADEAESGTVTLLAAARDLRTKSTLYLVKNYAGAEVIDFPALLRLSPATGFSYDKVRDLQSASDLRIVDPATDQELPFEIDKWDPYGESLVWVKMPSFRKGAKICVQCGGETPYVENGRMKIWTGMTGVWHLADTSFGNSASADSKVLSLVNRSTVGPTTGPLGTAREICNSTIGQNKARQLYCADDGSLDLGTNLTVSVWVRYIEGQNVGDDNILSRRNSPKKTDQTSNGWGLMLKKDNAKALKVVGSNRDAVTVSDFFANPVNDGEWHCIAAVYDGSSVDLYENGEFRATVNDIVPIIDNDLVFSVGNTPNYQACSFKGSVDEVRLCRGSLSSDRLKADYMTVMENPFVAESSCNGLSIIIR